MKLKEINIKKINTKIHDKVLVKSLQTIFKEPVKIVYEETRSGWGTRTTVIIGGEEYVTNTTGGTNIEGDFDSIMQNVLCYRHGAKIISQYETHNYIGFHDVVKKYKYKYRLEFLEKNHIDGSPENFEGSIKKHILKRYGLLKN